MTNTKEDQAVWDMYFSALCGWAQHPGYYRENATKPTIDDCAEMATKMMEVRQRRLESSD